MAIYTPGGLKIRFPVDYSFALLARLYPRVDAYAVLKTAEGIDCIPAFLSFITAIVCFGIQASPFIIGLSVTIASTIGVILTTRGLFIVPGLVTLGTLYSHLSGFFVYFVVIAIIGYATTGMWGGSRIFHCPSDLVCYSPGDRVPRN